MKPIKAVASAFEQEVLKLRQASSTREETYYPAIRDLWSELLKLRQLPFEVRTATSEKREGTSGSDYPDLAIYDRGDFVSVFAEVKLPDVELGSLARSQDGNDQIGRYLCQTGVIIITNVRSFGLLACTPGYKRLPNAPVPPLDRKILEIAELWPSQEALNKQRPISPETVTKLADLLEQAVTEFAPIAEPSSLAKILALQARRAKEDLPDRFDAVAGLLEDYREALGLRFQEAVGFDFFRSSLIQTAFYALFTGWTLWHRAKDGTFFEWDRLDRYLKIPFLGKLFYEFKHPDRLAELGLAPHLDRAAQTLRRVDRDLFFSRFTYSTLDTDDERDPSASAAITYFYEPFLEAFDPGLRDELGVWYTPPEIVRYQVKTIDDLLRRELGCERGFADKRVVVLDPCCGTGAYLLEIVQCIAKEVRKRGDRALLGAELGEAVASRIIGFEILTAPFVISHLQLYLMLDDLGVPPSSKKRPAVFLTNALTGWGGPEQVKLNFPELQEEHDRAKLVKDQAEIIVVLGNPPYNRFAGTALAEEQDLVDHYKGILRRERRDRKGNVVFDDDGKPIMIQDGESLLYKEWGVRKQLLDELYVRFFRLAEKRIGEDARDGVVSYISNSSYLTGRSHPLMRESLLKNFHDVWIDNLHGNRLASERTPWGESCQTVFNFGGSAGNKVGICISTFLKRSASATSPEATTVNYRDFWGGAEQKRHALIESLSITQWDHARRLEAAKRPEGPREYEQFHPSRKNRWLLAPRDFNAGFEAWPALDELFPAFYQGVNPNRGLDGSIIDVDRSDLACRMRAYFENEDFQALAKSYPALFERRARYEPKRLWTFLRSRSRFRRDQILPYLVFPLDTRWIYYEKEGKLLNERRPEYGNALVGNEFLLAVPQPRRPSETRPLLTQTLADLHVYDRGVVCFPREVTPGSLVAAREANIAPRAWQKLQTLWELTGDLRGAAAKDLVGRLFRCSIGILHATAYEDDNREALAQDWAHIPVPKGRELADELSSVGDQIRVLLDPLADAESGIRKIIGQERMTSLGVPQRTGEKPITSADLCVSISYYGAAKGRWIPREFRDEEAPLSEWGANTGALYINDEVFFANVPQAVWRYELGGYPVLKKWLGYRKASDRAGKPLTTAETSHFRSMIQRIAALLALQPELNRLYEKAKEQALTAEEMNLREPPVAQDA